MSQLWRIKLKNLPRITHPTTSTLLSNSIKHKVEFVQIDPCIPIILETRDATKLSSKAVPFWPNEESSCSVTVFLRCKILVDTKMDDCSHLLGRLGNVGALLHQQERLKWSTTCRWSICANHCNGCLLPRNRLLNKSVRKEP
jgi:hypothetical protein